MSRWPSVCAAAAPRRVRRELCGAPIRNAPKSPALCESGMVDRRRRPELAEERPHPRDERRRCRAARTCRIGFWMELAGSAAAASASRANSSARSAPTVTPTARAVERDRVAVGEREWRRAAPHSRSGRCPRRSPRRPSPATRPAPRADRGAVRIAVEAALDRRSLPDDVAREVTTIRLIADRDRVADLRALDGDRQRHLVAAPDRGRDHRPPAPRRRVADDVAAVATGPSTRTSGPSMPS